LELAATLNSITHACDRTHTNTFELPIDVLLLLLPEARECAGPVCAR